MDEHRERAQRWLMHAIESFNGTFGARLHAYATGDASSKCRFDVVVGNTESGRVHAVVEAKCRENCTRATFNNEFGGRWLLSESKLTALRKSAIYLQCSAVGWIILPDENVMLMLTLFDWRTLKPLSGIEIRTTATQRECTDKRSHMEPNAFIPVANATVTTLLPFHP